MSVAYPFFFQAVNDGAWQGGNPIERAFLKISVHGADVGREDLLRNDDEMFGLFYYFFARKIISCGTCVYPHPVVFMFDKKMMDDVKTC